MRVLFKNIGQLVQIRSEKERYVSGAAMHELPCIEDAFLLVEEGRILDFGPMEDYVPCEADQCIDASGRVLLPAWCDSHTHIVYAGDRVDEFVDKIHGLSYEEIAARGGGILHSAKRLARIPEDQLYEESRKRVEEVIALGTGALEIKSGYGLTLDAELKMLRVIGRLRERYSIPVVATFLAAHAIPEAFANNRKGYVDQVINTWIPAVVEQGIAQYIDVFCEEGYFTAGDTARILEAGVKAGLKPKIHVNQFHAIGGVQVGVQHGALSVDHLEVMRPEDVTALKGSDTMPVALPGCSFFLGIPYTPAKDLIAEGLPLALASDYNPGSTPSGNMNFVVAAACVKMKMTPEAAINAATLNGAYAMGLHAEVGSITRGKWAHLLLTKPITSYRDIPYHFSTPLIEEVFVRGEGVGPKL